MIAPNPYKRIISYGNIIFFIYAEFFNNTARTYNNE